MLKATSWLLLWKRAIPNPTSALACGTCSPPGLSVAYVLSMRSRSWRCKYEGVAPRMWNQWGWLEIRNRILALVTFTRSCRKLPRFSSTVAIRCTGLLEGDQQQEQGAQAKPSLPKQSDGSSPAD